MKKLITKALFLIIPVCLVPMWMINAAEETEVSLETKTKAVFLYNFTKFIKWPDTDTTVHFRITVVGNSDIISPLEEIADRQKVEGRKIKVYQFSTLPDDLNTHILFVSSSEKARLDNILKKTGGKPILVVSDTEGFADRGASVNFIIKEGRVKFEINTSALDSTGLQVSSQLLKLAIFVEGE